MPSNYYGGEKLQIVYAKMKNDFSGNYYLISPYLIISHSKSLHSVLVAHVSHERNSKQHPLKLGIP